MGFLRSALARIFFVFLTVFSLNSETIQQRFVHHEQEKRDTGYDYVDLNWPFFHHVYNWEYQHIDGNVTVTSANIAFKNGSFYVSDNFSVTISADVTGYYTWNSFYANYGYQTYNLGSSVSSGSGGGISVLESATSGKSYSLGSFDISSIDEARFNVNDYGIFLGPWDCEGYNFSVRVDRTPPEFVSLIDKDFSYNASIGSYVAKDSLNLEVAFKDKFAPKIFQVGMSLGAKNAPTTAIEISYDKGVTWLRNTPKVTYLNTLTQPDGELNSFNILIEKVGSNELWVRSQDALGNYSAPQSYKIVIDPDSPIVEKVKILKDSVDVVGTNPFSSLGTIQDNNNIELQVAVDDLLTGMDPSEPVSMWVQEASGGVFGDFKKYVTGVTFDTTTNPGFFTFKTTLPEGIYKILFTAQDRVSNVIGIAKVWPNGVNPPSKSTSPFTKANSIDLGVIPFTIIVDKTNPSLSLSPVATSARIDGVNSVSLQVNTSESNDWDTWVKNDLANSYYQVDNKTPVALSLVPDSSIDAGLKGKSIVTVDTSTYGEGIHSVKVVVTDNVGNQTSSLYDKNIVLDKTPPSASSVLPYPSPSTWINSNATVGLSGVADTFSSPVSVEYELVNSNTGTTNVSNALTLDLTQEGVNTVKFKLTDTLGNSQTLAPIIVNIDKTKPILAEPIKPSQFTKLSLAHTEVLITESTLASTVDKVSLKVQGPSNPIGTVYNLPTSALSNAVNYSKDYYFTLEGTYSFIWSSVDKAGNTADSKSFDVMYDITQPKINPPPLASYYLKNALKTSFSASDFGSGVDKIWYSIDGATWTEGGDINISDEGVHTYRLRAIDKAGNLSETGDYRVVLDYQRPILGVTPQVASGNSPIGFDFSTTDFPSYDGSQLTLQVKNVFGEWETIQASYRSSLPGSQTLEFRLIDRAGNISDSKSVSFVYDVSGPLVKLNLPGNGGTTNQPVRVSTLFSATDTYSGVDHWDYHINGNTVTGDTLVATDGVYDAGAIAYDGLGNSTGISAKFIVDTKSPVIKWNSSTQNLDTWSQKGDEVVNITLDKNELWDLFPIGDLVSVDYDQSKFFVRMEASESTLTLESNIDNYNESGTYPVTIRVRDKAGNLSNTLTWNIRFDKDAPTNSKAEVLSMGRWYGESEFLGTGDFDVQVAGIDNSQAPLRYRAIQTNANTPPSPEDWPKEWIPDSKRFSVRGLSDTALTHIYYQFMDAAGNISDVFKRNIAFDIDVPASPLIIGLTHPYASKLTDVARVNQAKFKVQASASGASGIDSLLWNVYRGSSKPTAQSKSINGGTLVGDDLSLPQLTDNTEGEFYWLGVQAKGGNGKLGQVSYYPFRIDQTPPEQFSINSATHPNETVAIANDRVVFDWLAPVDLTGVKAYHYKVFADQGPNLDNIRFDDSWPTTSLNSVVIGKDQHRVIDGQFTLVIGAEDWSGNVRFAERSVKIDKIAPHLEDGILHVLSALGQKETSVSWSALDGDAGTAYLSLQLFEVQNGQLIPKVSPIVRSQFPGNYTFTGLSESAVYFVSSKVYDEAGNESIYDETFNLKGEKLADLEIKVPFDEVIGGYQVSGSVLKRGETIVKSDASLQYYPDAPWAGSKGSTLGQLPLNQVSIADSKVELATNANLSLSSKLHNFVLNSKGIGLSSRDGFYLSDASLLFPADPPVNFEIAKVKLSSAPDYRWYAEPIATGTFSFESKSGWLFRDGQGIKLDEESVIVSKAFLVGNYQGLKLSQGGSTGGIWVKDLKLDAPASVYEAQMGQSFVLETDTLKLEVLESVLQNDKLHIAKARIILPNGIVDTDLVVSDLFVGLNGTLIAGPAFDITRDVKIATKDFKVLPKKVSVKDQWIIIDQASLQRLDNKEFTALNLRLGKNGIDLDQGKIAGEFEKQFFGFTVRGFGGSISQGNWKFDDAEILLGNYGGAKIPLKDFTIQMLSETIVGKASFDGLEALKSEYGDGQLLLKSLELSSEGVFAGLKLEIPQTWKSSASLIIPRISLKASGEFKTISPLEEFKFSFQNLDFIAKNLSFDGKSLDVASLETVLPKWFGSQPYEFKELSVLGSGEVVKNAKGSSKVSFETPDWNFGFDALELGSAGFGGFPTVQLPASFGSDLVTLGLMSIDQKGGFTLKDSEFESEILVDGWTVGLQNISLSGPDLIFKSAQIKLPGIMGGESIDIGQITLNKSGELLQSASNGISRFRALNGFMVEATGVHFDHGSLLMGGKIFFPGLESSFINFAQDAIEVTNEGYALAQGLSPVQVSIMGYNVTLSSFRFTERELSIDASKIQIANWLSMDLPAFSLRSNGEFKIPSLGDSAMNFDLIPGQIGLSVSSVKFDNTGLHVDAFLSLPKSWEAGDLYFEDLTVTPDGKVTCNVGVKTFSFSSDKLGLEANLKEIWLHPNSFSVASAEFTLTKGEMAGKTLGLYDLVIGFDGSLTVGEISSEPLKLFGFEVGVTGFRMTSSSIGLKGFVRLPTDFVVDQLAGRKFNLNALDIGFDGQVRNFDVAIEGGFDFPLFDGLSMYVEDITLKKSLLVINKATVNLPSEFGENASAQAIGFSFDFETGAFNIGEIVANNLHFDLKGLLIDVRRLAIKPNVGMELSGSLTLPMVDPDGNPYPDFLAGKILDVKKIEILNGFVIGQVDAKISGISGPLFGKAVLIEDGMVHLAHTDTDFYFELAGKITLGSDMPSGLAGQQFEIKNFGMNLGDGSIREISAGYTAPEGNPLNIDLFGVLKLELASLAITKSDIPGAVNVDASGAFVLGDQFPDQLKGTRVSIKEFSIGGDGKIKKLDAALGLGADFEIFKGLHAKDTVLEAVYDKELDMVNFGLVGTILLDETLPKPIGGISAEIKTFTFNSKGKIKNVDVAFKLPENADLFGVLTLNNSGVGIKKDELSNELIIDVFGTVILQKSFPEGLAGLQIPIKTLKFSTTGGLLAMDLGFKNLNAKLFNYLAIEQGGFNVKKTLGSNDVEFAIEGTLRLPSTLPGSLANLGVRINTFVINTSGKIVALDTELAGSLKIPLFAGMEVEIRKLGVSLEGFAVGGKITLPSGLAEGLPRRIEVDVFKMNYDGKLVELSAGFDKATLSLAGFAVGVEGFRFGTGGIKMDKASFRLPDSIGGQTISVKNGGFDTAGKFLGTIELDKLNFDVAGLKVDLNFPQFDFNIQAISFKSVQAKLPEALGNATFKLMDVSVSPAGLEIGGAEVRLPDMTVGPGLRFYDCMVAFSRKGNNFRIEGEGKADLPGVGSFEAAIGFTNVSEMYPIGLVRAYFSFEGEVGLPLPPTPIFLNGIRGGIAFGPAKEIPEKVRRYFPDHGMRLQLGLSFYAFRKSLITARADVWVDVWNLALATRAQVSVFEGLIKAEMLAAFNPNMGFYGYMGVQFLIIRGEAEVWIFKYHGEPLVNGRASVSIFLPKGYLWGWFPPSDMEFGGIGADIGTFTNGRKGVKGWAKLICFDVAAFIGDGGVDFNAGSYSLVMPWDN